MHTKMGVGKLSNRRKLDLCGLMYKRSCKNKYIDRRDLPTRLFDKIVLKVTDVI